MEYALEMRNITKEFPGVKALLDVTFNAYPGEILALMGENGAGKSTLMKVLSGSYPYSSYTGKILIRGTEMNFGSPAQSEEAGVAMIYQEISMHLDLTVAENLFVGRWPLKRRGILDKKKMNAEAAKVLGRMELGIKPTVKLRDLNTSQMQMVSIARALHKNPSILVLDEPTSALTGTETEHLFRILHKLKSEGICCVLISHKMDEVFENADRITVLRDGRVINTHVKSEVDRRLIINEMVGRDFESYYPSKKDALGEVSFVAENFTVPHPFTANKNIVEDVGISVKKGEILGLAGLVGAGRSELAAAIVGKIGKTSGSVFIEGKRVDIKNPSDALKHGIALVTEDRKADGFVGPMSVKENITLASLRHVSNNGRMLKKKERESAQHYFKSMDIRAPSINVKLETLSGGNQQKVVLSKCLMTRPKVLIMDEPTKGIDVAAKSKIYNIMAELAHQGIAIIMISSEMPELISMADRVVVLSGGRNMGTLDRNELDQQEIMRRAVTYA